MQRNLREDKMLSDYIKVCAASHPLKVANPRYNCQKIIECIQLAAKNGAQLIALPELCITGYTCQDLFFQQRLLNEALEGLSYIAKATQNLSIVAVVGLPISLGSNIYNCAAIIKNGKIIGITPKSYLPNSGEFYEKRWFAPASHAVANHLEINGECIPFGKLLFDLGNCIVGIEICEDLWVPVSPSAFMCLAGADVIINLSASNELAGKHYQRENLIMAHSAKCICAYAYASASMHESTTDAAFSGICYIAENGAILAEGKKYQEEASMIYATCDIAKIRAERRLSDGFSDNAYNALNEKFDIVPCAVKCLEEKDFNRNVPKNPFLPDAKSAKSELNEIINVQIVGLMKRLKHTGMQKAILGISGGLDSTLALLSTCFAFDKMGLPRKNIIAITMPGFGTTGHTYQSAWDLMRVLEVEASDIDIKPSCLQHFSDIGHDISAYDSTYENTQARERTQILMDLANKNRALLIGTGDLSELALGWCTYNGDHMSMYAINASIPKTIIKHIIAFIIEDAGNKQHKLKQVLERILFTPISPELLPPDEKGEIAQKTQDIVGPYELHDFFLYYMIRFGADREKIVFLAQKAFEKEYSQEEINSWLDIFYKRFFSQQFKRSCVPDGPKATLISLSPRADWKMPSDADGTAWL